ncbi:MULTISPECIES: hypothetical protein [Acidovorax]|uniref:Uncharacterized protein n=1 Tax=Acidovorax facilis TaxID=12917 RepID=A0ABV8D5M8_9BURK|nr:MULTISPECIES: hypothetical protein [Acidovorax]MBO1011344.1 hypothetical protein [Acidovorax sp. SD340]MCO4245357.1 hypothetical protein [Acidovorax facilis]
METPTQKAQAAADAAARRTLEQAARFAEMHSTAKPWLSKTMRRPGGKPVLVRVDWPGVLRVFDPATGECLARSQVGDLYQLEGKTTAGEPGPGKKD